MTERGRMSTQRSRDLRTNQHVTLKGENAETRPVRSRAER